MGIRTLTKWCGCPGYQQPPDPATAGSFHAEPPVNKGNADRKRWNMPREARRPQRCWNHRPRPNRQDCKES